MNCPSCNKKAITMGRWMTGRNAFHTRCDNCGVELKASTSTWIGLGLTLLSFGVAFAATQYAGWGATRAEYKLMVALPIVLVGGVMGWFVGGYQLAEDPPQ